MNTVEKFLRAGNRYLKDMDLEDMAALKFCLGSMGILMGIGIPARLKKPVGLVAGLLFVGTYIPLMSKFVDAFHEVGDDEIHPIPAEGDAPSD